MKQEILRKRTEHIVKLTPDFIACFSKQQALLGSTCLFISMQKATMHEILTSPSLSFSSVTRERGEKAEFWWPLPQLVKTFAFGGGGGRGVLHTW